jgi:hypothetical protein
MRLLAPLAVALMSVVTGACASTAAPESKDPSYVRGSSSYAAARWSDAQDSLDAFLESSCGFGPAAGCQRAIWMKVQADLQVHRPAQAVVDADRAESLGWPTEHLEPPVAALRAQALTQIGDLDRTGARTARLEVSFRDDVGCQVVELTFSLDLDAPEPVALDHLDGRSLLFDPMLPSGDHLLRMAAHFECAFRGGKLQMFGRSSHAFLIGPEQPTKVLVSSYLRTDAPPLAPISQRLAFDFKSLPPSASAR